MKKPVIADRFLMILIKLILFLLWKFFLLQHCLHCFYLQNGEARFDAPVFVVVPAVAFVAPAGVVVAVVAAEAQILLVFPSFVVVPVVVLAALAGVEVAVEALAFPPFVPVAVSLAAAESVVGPVVGRLVAAEHSAFLKDGFPCQYFSDHSALDLHQGSCSVKLQGCYFLLMAYCYSCYPLQGCYLLASSG